MSDTRKFDFREWLIPPVLVPIFFALPNCRRGASAIV